MKGIIIAAGRCVRLRPLTDDTPKCLLPIYGKSILDHLARSFNSNGIDDIIIIKGYKKEKIMFPQFRYYVDDVQNGILSSLMYAKDEMDSSFIATYSDIFVEKEVVETLLKTGGDIVAVVDTDWREYYVNRKDHGVDEAENVILEGDKIIEIGKHVNHEKCDGEFIGMIKCSEKGAEIFKRVYEESKKRYDGKPFQKSSEFEKAYLTDILQEIIDRGYEINVAKIQKGWAEFDTIEDYERAVNKKMNGRENNCIFCGRNNIKDYLLDETPNFYLIANKNPFCLGHVMIVSKDHYSCIGALPKELYGEYESFLEKTKDKVKNNFAEPIIVEQVIPGQGINHAHAHILPSVSESHDFSKKGFGDFIPEGFKIEEVENNLNELFKIFNEDREYISIEDRGKLYVCRIKGALEKFKSARQIISQPNDLNLLDWESQSDEPKQESKELVNQALKKLKGGKINGEKI